MIRKYSFFLVLQFVFGQLVVWIDSAQLFEPLDGGFFPNYGFKAEDVVQERAADDDEPMLVFSTRTDISKIPTRMVQNGRVDPSLIGKVVEKNAYVIQAFDVSFKDRLALYGINSLNSFPLGGGENYLGSNSEQTMSSIKFDTSAKAFAVDWVDHNVYAYYERKIRLHKLTSSQTSVVVYNASQSVRNIVVEHQKHFIAWIGNDNNVVRANKDGSSVSTVYTSKVKIECMAIDSSSGRFFFFIMENVAQTYRAMAAYDYGLGGAGGGGAVGGGGGLNDYNDMNSMGSETGGTKFAVLYSIDYNGEFPAINEMQVNMNQRGAIPVQMARYKGSTYLIREYQNQAGGKVNELGMPDRSNKFQNILTKQNWQFTSLQVVHRINVVKDLCAKDNPCGWSTICVHMTDELANCVDANQVYRMTTATTGRPRTVKTTPVMKMLFGDGRWMYWLLVAMLIPICAGLAYFIYWYYLKEDNEGDASQSMNPEAGVPGADGSLPGVQGSKVGSGQPKSGILTPLGDDLAGAGQTPGGVVNPEDKGIWQKIMSWLGFGSEEDEQHPQVDLTDQTMNTPQDISGVGTPITGGKSQIGVPGAKGSRILSMGRGFPKSQLQPKAMESSSGSKKPKDDSFAQKQSKRTKDRKNLYASLDKMLDIKPNKSKSKSKKDEPGADSKLTVMERSMGESNDDNKSEKSKKFSFQHKDGKSKSRKASSKKPKEESESTDDGGSKFSVLGGEANKSKKPKNDKEKKGKSKSKSAKRSSSTDGSSRTNNSSMTGDEKSRSKRKRSRRRDKSKLRSETSKSSITSPTSNSSGVKGSGKSKVNETPDSKKEQDTQSQSLSSKAVRAAKSMASTLFAAGPSLGFNASDMLTSSASSAEGSGGKKFKWYDPLGCC